MKSFLFAVLATVSITVAAQNSNNIVIGKIDTIYSKILNEKREVWVHVPGTNPNTPFSKENYPVIYLLDGDGHFSSVVGMIEQLSEVNGNTVTPKMIVVGITNTDRARDLTPSHYIAPGDFGQTSGGGENFTAFMEKELIPYIESHYPTAPYRMIIGHSLGGLMVINSLVNHPGLFNSYLAIDPSIWWDDQKLLKQATATFNKLDLKGKTFFLGIANTMVPGMDTLLVQKDTSLATGHIRSILKLAALLNSDHSNGLRSAYKYYNNDDHGSVPLIAEYDALRFIFSEYRIPAVEQFFDSTYNSDSAVNAHYKKVSAQMGYKIIPGEEWVNQLGYALLQNKLFDKAYAFFNMNIQNYPTSFNTYDSMGDYYDAKKDKAKAIEFYKKALALHEFPDTRQKLEKLQKGN